jgi:hypothetical protein
MPKWYGLQGLIIIISNDCYVAAQVCLLIHCQLHLVGGASCAAHGVHAGMLRR